LYSGGPLLSQKLCRAKFFKIGLQEFAQLIELFLLLWLQLELIVIEADATDLYARDFLLGSNRPNGFLKVELSV
jgi:hypothetical protein